MQITDLAGQFSIIGSNQDNSNASYKGTLTLSVNSEGRIIAKWLISGDQLQRGTGFFKDNILVINFNYIGEDDQTYKGVIVYKCLTEDILEGFWSEKHGDPSCLGIEKAFRIRRKAGYLN